MCKLLEEKKKLEDRLKEVNSKLCSKIKVYGVVKSYCENTGNRLHSNLIVVSKTLKTAKQHLSYEVDEIKKYSLKSNFVSDYYADDERYYSRVDKHRYITIEILESYIDDYLDD